MSYERKLEIYAERVFVEELDVVWQSSVQVEVDLLLELFVDLEDQTSTNFQLELKRKLDQ